MIVDTHCHLDFKDFDADRDDVLGRARDAGIVRIINVGSSMEGSRHAVELAKKYDIVYASVGVHPHDATLVTNETFEEIKRLAASDKVVAIGEVGLDYYRNLSPKEKQISAFRRFVGFSEELNLPLIIHSREADDHVIGILKEHCGLSNSNPKRIRGVIHCFSGSSQFLKECLDLGFYISFTCNLTFKKAENLRELAKTIPTEKILLETDTPFLAPEEMRGKRNEPAYLKYLVEEWSKITGLAKNDIERITTYNANKLFNLELEDEKSKIAYEIRDSLYLNITNRCTNNCYFCVRAQTAFVKGHNLKLDKEPAADEILKAVGKGLRKYKEVVFCGYGEPTTRLDIIKSVAADLKTKGIAIRLVTNGHGDLINGRPIVKELVGLVDKISVSLNTDSEALYLKICKPEFGAKTYKAVIDFIKDCVKNNIKTEVTCLNLPEVDIKGCETAALALGASFRMRRYGVTG